jgi:MFS family permease
MSGSDRQWKPRTNPWIVAVTVTLGAFMEVLDTTIVNVSLPHIAGSLSVSTDESTWALTTYLVANGIVLTISGALSRTMGRKCYFMVCLAGFTAASFACGTCCNERSRRWWMAASRWRRRCGKRQDKSFRRCTTRSLSWPTTTSS